MSSLVASLVTELTVNLAKWRSDMGEAAKISNTRLREIQRSADQTVKGMEKVGRGLQTALGAIGVGLSVGTVVTFLKDATAAAIQYGEEVQKAAAKTGLSSEQFAQLADAARLADVDMQTLSKGLRAMQVNISELASKNPAATATFKALGLTIKDLQGLRADQQLELIADRIAALPTPADRARAGVEIFARAWDILAPLLIEGSAALREARTEIEKLGGALSSEEIQRLADADNSIKQLALSWDILKRTVVADRSEGLAAGFDAVTEAIARNKTGILSWAQVWAGVKEAFAKGGSGFNGTLLSLVNAPSSTDLLKAIQRQALVAPLGSEARTAAMSRAAAPIPGLAPGFGDEEKKKAVGKLQEIAEIAITSLPNTFYQELYASTQTAIEKQLAAWKEFDAQVGELVASGTISASEGTARIVENNAQYLEEIKITAEKIFPESERNQLSTFAEEAGRNIQDSFANFLFDPFSEGLNGMLSGFLDTIRRMVAELAAQELLRAFFSWAGGAIGGAAGNFISGLGTRASGGPVTAGGAYLVGERGPELLMMGNRSGVVIPSGAGGGISLTYNIDARGADANRIMAILPPLLKQNKDATISEIMRLQRQGRFA